MMKRFGYMIIICLSVALVWSCSGNSSKVNDSSTSDVTSSVDESVNAAIDNAQSDSIAMLFGSLVGNDYAVKFAHGDDYLSNVDSKDFVTGLNVALNSANRSASYTEGVRAAVNILKEMESFANYNVALDRERVAAAIERRLRADSVSESDVAEAVKSYNMLLQRIYSAEDR